MPNLFYFGEISGICLVFGVDGEPLYVLILF